MVKRAGMMKIIHERYKYQKKNPDPAVQEHLLSFDAAIEHNKEIEPLLTKTQEVLSPVAVLHIFQRIPQEVSSSSLHF